MTKQAINARKGWQVSWRGRGVLTAAALGLLALSVACGSGNAPASSTTANSDAANVANQLWARISAGDAAGAAALVAPSATWQGGPGCAPAPCVGTQQIATSFGMRVAAHAQVLVSDLHSSGSVATLTLQVSSDRITAAGVSRVMVHDTMTVNQGKVTDGKEVFDMTDAQTAAFVQFSQAHPGPHA